MSQHTKVTTAGPTPHYHYVDALRGYAILLVITVHASQAAIGLGWPWRQLFDQGARGVQLFFVASALTLLMSWHARNDGALPFYVRRCFRILPMFWLALVFFVALNGFEPRYFAPNGIGPVHVLVTALSLHGWHPETITSVVPGSWSIADEMTFYLLFPPLVFLIRGWRSAALALILAMLLSNALFAFVGSNRSLMWHGQSDALVSTFIHLWFPTQFPVFLVGFLVYFFIREWRGRLSLWALRVMLLCAVSTMVALCFVSESSFHGFHLMPAVYYAICFGLFTFCLAEGVGGWLVNAPICFLGKVSFGAYLWHFAILETLSRLARSGVDPLNLLGEPHGMPFFIMFFPSLLASTVFLSAITYRLVERPMIEAGNRLLRRTSLVTCNDAARA